MKKMAIYGIILLNLLNADEISASIQENSKGVLSTFSVSTNAKNDQCSITINDKIIYQRECEYEYEPRLIFYAPLGNWNEVWVFQDTPMGNACDGGDLRIFERESGSNTIHYRGEIDFCGGPNPNFTLKGDEFIITNESMNQAYSLQRGELKKHNSRVQ